MSKMTGKYYFFDNRSVVFNKNTTGLDHDNVAPPKMFKSDKAARKYATAIKAELYKITYKNGVQVKSELLYAPWN